MFIKYVGVTPLTIQTKEGPIEVITDEIIELYNEEYDELRQRHPGLFEMVEIDAGGLIPIPEATQPEAETGTIVGKYMTPSTTNPNNYTAQAGALQLNEVMRTYSPTNSLVGGRTVQEVIDLAVATVSIIMPANTARVTPNGNNATGMVGRFDKPFQTPEAAMAAIPFSGCVWVEYGSYTVALAMGNLKTMYLLGASISGTITGGVFSSIYGLNFNGNIASTPALQNCAITLWSNGSVISGTRLVNTTISGDSCRILDIPYLLYGASFFTMTLAGFLDMSFMPNAFIAGTGPLVTHTGGATGGLNIVISNIQPNSQAATIGSLVDAGNVSISNFITLRNSKIVTSSDAIKSALTGANTISVILDGSSIKSTGYIHNNSTSGGTASITLRRASEVDSAQIQNIAWSTSPANVVTIKTTPGTLSTKDWDTLGIVNIGASTDYTTVDATLSI